MTTDEIWMSRAIQLARKGVYGAPPNPLVGAVIVCDDRIIGEGYHRKCGEGHAEVNAFASVKREDLLVRAKMYVTLEPCSHYGRTPPCAKLIIDKGVKEVYIGCQDPFSKVDGKGIRMLREAGIKVTVGILEKPCKQLISHFLTQQFNDRPYVMLKWAQSNDGFIDRKRNDGQPAHLSTSRSLLRVHALRLQHQAIMVGTNTALLDNPRLNARLVTGPQPLRIVIDKNCRLPESLHLFDGTQQTLVVGHSDKHPLSQQKNYQFLQLENSENMLRQTLSYLKRQNIQSLLVEGGAKLLQSFIDQGLWDEIQVEQSAIELSDGIHAPIIPNAYPPTEEHSLGVTYQHYYNCHY